MTPVSQIALRRMALFEQMMGRYGATITRELQQRHRGDDEALIRACEAALGVAVEQRTRVHLDCDELTILLCARGCGAGKTITPDGIRDFGAGKWFKVTSVTVSGIGALSNALDQISRERRAFIIRGRLRNGATPPVRRTCHPDRTTGEPPAFEASQRQYLGVDFDALALPDGVSPVDVAAVAEVARNALPEPFRMAACWAQLTAGAGIKPGARSRLFFWLSRPVPDTEAKAWLKSSPIDTSLYSPVQPHWTAAPRFVGVRDPVPVRSALISGAVDEVLVPAPEVLIPPRPKPQVTRAPKPGTSAGNGCGLRGIGSDRAMAYARACLRSLAVAQEGDRHPSCVRIGARLFGLCKAGLLDEREVTAAIKRVMRDAHGFGGGTGRELAEVDNLLRWAWTHAEPEGLRDA